MKIQYYYISKEDHLSTLRFRADGCRTRQKNLWGKRINRMDIADVSVSINSFVELFVVTAAAGVVISATLSTTRTIYLITVRDIYFGNIDCCNSRRIEWNRTPKTATIFIAVSRRCNSATNTSSETIAV
mmetsp:Transcript_23871/g.34176  ORF Transcript_23871/g.34176 Transcript_23871/m.34176 type:complete len:129 (+) Transcript_23871:36-422(+)